KMTLMTSMFVTAGGNKGSGWANASSRAPMQIADQQRRVFLVELKAHVPIDEIMSPSFWAVGARDLKRLDRIEIVMPNAAGDGHHNFCVYVVRNVGSTGAVVAMYPDE